MTTNRPATHKPRGVCRYYNVPRGCFAGDKCKFLHGEPPVDPKPEEPPLLTPYDKAKRCRYYAQGFCKRGDSCWFLHVADPGPSAPSDEEDEPCSICFEKPSTYALLSGCSHIFCTSCIKQWRDPLNRPGGVPDSVNTKKCPMCRTPSKFITPSSRFWKQGTPEKDAVVQAYKESMARVPCRYFQKSIQKNKDRPMCPYGKDCFYQHLKEDGTPYIFKDGVDVCMRRYRQGQSHRRGGAFGVHFMPLSLADLDFMLPVTDRTQGDAPSALRRIQEQVGRLEVIHDMIENLDFVEVPGGRNGPRQGSGTSRRRGRDEDELRDFITEQMIASISRMRAHRSGTPPPPLEPIDDEGAPSTRRPPPADIDYDSDGSMPRLHSVSASSDEDEWSDDAGESDEDDDSDVELRAMDLVRMGLLEVAARETAAEAPPDSEPDEPDDEGPPPLEAIDNSESEEEEGPFVTDGRGRAVWREENKRDRSSERDGEGEGSSGRSILGWFNALF